MKLLIAPIASLIAGAVIALVSIYTGWSTGWLGAGGLIAWAFLARRKWTRLEKTTELDPSAPEKVMFIQCIGTGLLLGHLVTGLLHPDINLRLGNGNMLAVDSWMMIAALVFMAIIFRKDRSIQDERNHEITAKGTRTGYWLIIAMIGTFAIFLAALPLRQIPTPSPFQIGNILIAIIMTSIIGKLVTQLFDYAKDTEEIASFEPER